MSLLLLSIVLTGSLLSVPVIRCVRAGGVL
jgi:hypothetical protein